MKKLLADDALIRRILCGHLAEASRAMHYFRIDLLLLHRLISFSKALEMHDTAMLIGNKFIATYAAAGQCIILEIGAQDVNGSLREACPDNCIYLGLDVEHGKGVDLKIDPSRPIPLRAEFSDITISTSQMEHDLKFWATFLELCRVTKKGGLVYLSAPSNGAFHPYPVDAWRFYPDAGKCLVSFAEENGYKITLLESFTAPRASDHWNDFVAIFYMGAWNQEDPINYLTDHFNGQNAWKFGFPTLQNASTWTQDHLLLQKSIGECDRLHAQVQDLNEQLSKLKAERDQLVAQLLVAESMTKHSVADIISEDDQDIYNQCGLRSIHNHDFVNDPKFERAYARGVAAAGSDYAWHWRVHVGLWAALSALKIDGDFIQCGITRGFMSSAIMSRLDFSKTERTFYLLDTFMRVDPHYLSDLDRPIGDEERSQHELENSSYTGSVEAIRANFSEWPNSRIIEGAIPETLGLVDAQKIAFLHLDMNCALPEIAAIECFWDRLSPGAYVLMDGYAYRGCESQKFAMDKFASLQDIAILSLPTGQGLLIKPASTRLELPTLRPETSLPTSTLMTL